MINHKFILEIDFNEMKKELRIGLPPVRCPYCKEKLGKIFFLRDPKTNEVVDGFKKDWGKLKKDIYWHCETEDFYFRTLKAEHCEKSNRGFLIVEHILEQEIRTGMSEQEFIREIIVLGQTHKMINEIEDYLDK